MTITLNFKCVTPAVHSTTIWERNDSESTKTRSPYHISTCAGLLKDTKKSYEANAKRYALPPCQDKFVPS